MSNDPIHQFHVNDLIPAELGGFDVSITNATVFMVAGVSIAAGFLIWAMRSGALVPNRAQSVAEISYGFIHGMVRDAAGEEGVKKFFPFVMTLFLFIFMANMLGMFPYWFAPTSQIIVTAMMAVFVFATVLIVGFAKNGFKFLGLFVPSGVPLPLLIIVTPIEIISFFSRPLSHAVRLWANILAGHLVLKVFAGFVPQLLSAGGEIGHHAGQLDGRAGGDLVDHTVGRGED